MRALSAKEYLSQAYQIDKRINSKLEQVRSLRELSTKATSVTPEAPTSKSKNVHRLEDVIVKIMDFESEINKDIDELVELKREIDSVIRKVEPVELQTILELRYLSLQPWEQIAVTLHLDIRWVHRKHKKALGLVDEVLKIIRQ